MQYAPVLIPTLCRYEHLKKCLESLSKCMNADKTEVYIALDYPAKKTQEAGYRQICDYLDNSGIGVNFKEFHIIKRERNYGIGIYGNFSQARAELLEKNERLIFSEDDNVFSPNFLVYMNRGLELFKDDKTVLAINGYRHPYSFKFEGNNHFRHNVDFSAWGYGIWKNRVQTYTYEIRNGIFRSTFSFQNLLNLKQAGWNRLFEYMVYLVKGSKGNQIRIIDNTLSVYMRIKGMTVIMPHVSKVRNEGWDSTGNSFQRGMPEKYEKVAMRHKEQQIDTEKEFEYIGNSWTYFKENNRVAVCESDGRISFGEFVCLLFKGCFKNFIMYR